MSEHDEHSDPHDAPASGTGWADPPEPQAACAEPQAIAPQEQPLEWATTQPVQPASPASPAPPTQPYPAPPTQPYLAPPTQPYPALSWPAWPPPPPSAAPPGPPWWGASPLPPVAPAPSAARGPGAAPPLGPPVPPVPPFGTVNGYWAQGPWEPPGGHRQWDTAPPGKAGTSRSRPVLAGVLAGVLLLAGLGFGALIGRVVWSPASTSSGAPGTTSPGSQGFTVPNPGSSTFGGGSGAGSSAPGSPADAASIAHNIDPGLVDVNVTIGYQSLEGAGTGIVLTSGGEVLTNNHVIDGATKISVTDIGNGRTYNATVVGYARTKDVALLHLQGASGLQTVRIGSSASVSVGQAIVGVGNAGGSGGTPSYASGSVTALDQSITASDAGGGNSERLTGLIETNAGIQPGDSGGPLVDESGRVIGMDTACLGGGFQFQSTQCSGSQSFSIPINNVMAIVDQIRAGSGSTTVHIGPTAFLGVEVTNGTSNGSVPGGSGSLGLPGGPSRGSGVPGAAIVGVVSGGPASSAGLVQGDTITSLGGHSIATAKDLTAAMLTEKPGGTVSVGFVDASGQQHTTSVTLGSGPAQ